MSIKKDFCFPEMFLSMNDLGWLDSNNIVYGESLVSQKYLWLYDMRWLTCNKVINYEYDEDESDSIVPFAYTSGGDKWAWYLEDKPLLPVVFCPHDDDEGIIYAENIEAAVFRQILEFASQNNFNLEECKSWEMDVQMAKKHLVNWKNKFKKWFKKEWINELDKLISSDLKYYENKFARHTGRYYVFITPEEANEKIEKYLNFDLLNKPFIWTIED
ncbi:hypothetical protein [Clostridium estertheticum]|uniref:hypothetical protein n=1 Tax=Clostridium estertheticum TaxID=238834 RepID=UPI001CF325FF|nr:hypothetical protein [Clostridium estertheticum]MCB2362148.1 hypothetical protein [Clostridium estertheticum]